MPISGLTNKVGTKCRFIPSKDKYLFNQIEIKDRDTIYLTRNNSNEYMLLICVTFTALKADEFETAE